MSLLDETTVIALWQQAPEIIFIPAPSFMHGFGLDEPAFLHECAAGNLRITSRRLMRTSNFRPVVGVTGDETIRWLAGGTYYADRAVAHLCATARFGDEIAKWLCWTTSRREG